MAGFKIMSSTHEEWRRLVKTAESPRLLNRLSDPIKRQNLPPDSKNQPRFAALLDAVGKPDQLKNSSPEVKNLAPPLTLEDYRNQAIPVRRKFLLSRLRNRITFTAPNSDLKAPEQLQKVIDEAAHKYRLPKDLVTAVIKVESNFNPRAVSPVGARGLMQLMPATAEDLGVSNSFDIKENINGGCRYLKEMLERFNGKLELALAAYNAGPGAVEKYGKIPPYKETQDYVKRILAYC
jgi:soluble lytic murein transglycosylase-like protein